MGGRRPAARAERRPGPGLAAAGGARRGRRRLGGAAATRCACRRARSTPTASRSASAAAREELAARRAREAAATLRQALALWRGPALADVADERFAQPEIARLEDLRLACLTDRIDADLACGRHEEVAGELEALVRQHPLRERLRGQQMLALYRAGRQADALEAYRAAYEALVDGLGIEPSPELRALEAAILRHDVPAPRGRRRRRPRRSRRRAPARDLRVLAARRLARRADPESLRARLERYHELASRGLRAPRRQRRRAAQRRRCCSSFGTPGRARGRRAARAARGAGAAAAERRSRSGVGDRATSVAAAG